MKTATNEKGSIALDYNKMNRLTSVTDVFGQAVDYKLRREWESHEAES